MILTVRKNCPAKYPLTHHLQYLFLFVGLFANMERGLYPEGRLPDVDDMPPVVIVMNLLL